MKLERVLNYAHTLLEDVLSDGDVAVDATAGNGYDTVFLANLVGDTGKVFAFDVQQQAITSTQTRLEEQGLATRCEVILAGHEKVATYVTTPIKAATFNLGYLPGAEHAIVTKPDTTITALESIVSQLEVGGMIVMVIYYGHDGGLEERDAVLNYVASLPQKKINVLRYEFINQQNAAPFTIAIERIKL